MRYILLLLLVSMTFAADKSTMDTYASEAAAAYAEYMKATSKVADKAVKDLDVKFKAAMKKGDLEAATAIKTQMADISSGKALAALETTWKQKDATDLLNTPGSIKVISATFMAQGETVDVTEKVQAKFDSPNKKPFVLDAKVFGDPIPGFAKTLTIVYTIDGKKNSKTFTSWETIDQSKF